MAQNRENKRRFYKSVAARRTKKRRAFFEKKTKKGFNALIFEFDERALKSFCNRTLAAAFAAFSSSAFCLLSIFLYSLKFCVCFCMRERRRRWVFLKRMCKNPKRWWWWWWWWWRWWWQRQQETQYTYLLESFCPGNSGYSLSSGAGAAASAIITN